MTAKAHPRAPTELPPDVAATRLAQIEMAAQTHRPKAIRLAVKARADGLRSPLLHYLVAQDLKNAERHEDAIAELGLGLELAPNEAGLLSEVGFRLLDLERRAEAAKVFEAAVRIDPLWAPASYGYGWAAEQLGALDQARSAWERTLVLDPKHADALAGLAGLATRRGDWPGARDLARRSLELEPNQIDALTSLVCADLGEGDAAAAIQRLENLIPKLGAGSRANAHHLLGDALDSAGRYAEAFAAYSEGNVALRSLYAHEFAAPGGPTAAVVVRDMAAEFETTPADAWKSRSRAHDHGPVRRHVFLLGFPRSGTTLLEQIIATHPDMAALGERPVMLEAQKEFLSGTGDIERLAGTVGDLLEPYRDSYWSRVRQFVPDFEGKVFVDKHPLATFRLPLICKLFPNAKLIFALRDPRDVVLSCFRRAFKMNASMYEFTTLESAANFYDAVMSAGETYLGRLPLECHRLRYEDLVANFESESRALCDFLGVAWTPDLQDFAATNRSIATPSAPQVARGLYSEGVGQWRRYAKELEPVAPILAPWVEKLGYEP